jgi:hypothetical protein
VRVRGLFVRATCRCGLTLTALCAEDLKLPAFSALLVRERGQVGCGHVRCGPVAMSVAMWVVALPPWPCGLWPWARFG